MSARSRCLKNFIPGKIYEHPKEEPDFLDIAVTNVGRRVVTVTGLLWKNRLVRRHWVFQTPGEAPPSAQLPARLQDGDAVDFVIPLSALASINKPADFEALVLSRGFSPRDSQAENVGDIYWKLERQLNAVH